MRLSERWRVKRGVLTLINFGPARNHDLLERYRYPL